MSSIDTPFAQLMAEYAHAQAYSLSLVDGLSEDQVAWRPNENSSAIGWHLGHQAAVNHYMLRNLTAAEVTFNAGFDAVFDSATPEPGRGALPGVAEILGYRSSIADSTERVMHRIASGDVGAPEQLANIASGLMRAVINHEYQHATWIAEVRNGMLDTPAPAPQSTQLVEIEGYWMLGTLG